jgi:hypothetical protein
MPETLPHDEAERWTHLAAQAFSEANRTVDPKTRDELHNIATEYLALACKAQERQGTESE